jgi:hypothetical protein
MAKKQAGPLSKSKLMLGIQCHKNLWLSINNKELASEVDAATQFQFDEGNEVGALARSHFGKGKLIETDYWDYAKAHQLTQDAIKEKVNTIFEAAFLFDNTYARADILHRDSKGWHLVEVKKSTSVKDYHIPDSAIQTFIIESSGIKLKSISIMHINNEVIYPDLKKLFSTEDITELVRENLKKIPNEIEKLKKTAAAKVAPKIEIGPHCDDPFSCAFKNHCWKNFPAHSVFNLPNLSSAKKWELFQSGKKSITELNAKDYKNTTARAIEVTKSKKIFVDNKSIKAEMKKWDWPLYFFDFETIGPAIPRYEQTKPYGQVPFQFSCHVQNKPDSKKIQHFEYLHLEKTDPRPNLIKAMIDGLGTSGSIVSYNKAFEIGVIKKLAEFDSKNKKKLLALIERFVDPLPIFKSSVYHPDFNGSFSIKAVAPALIGSKLSYENLEIGDGSTAQVFADQILRGNIQGKQKDEIAKQLYEYCQQDTMAMVELVNWLREA